MLLGDHPRNGAVHAEHLAGRVVDDPHSRDGPPFIVTKGCCDVEPPQELPGWRNLDGGHGGVVIEDCEPSQGRRWPG